MGIMVYYGAYASLWYIMVYSLFWVIDIINRMMGDFMGQTARIRRSSKPTYSLHCNSFLGFRIIRTSPKSPLQFLCGVTLNDPKYTIIGWTRKFGVTL